MKDFNILCACLALVTSASGNQPPSGPASYEYGYDIHNPVSNDIKSHHEVRDGQNVLGFYTFKEADGSIRIVKYKVGPTTGFEAVVEKLKPDPLSENTIDNQEAAPTTHGLPETVSEPEGGHKSQYVAKLLNSVRRPHNTVGNLNPRSNIVESQQLPAYNKRNRSVQRHPEERIQQPIRQPIRQSIQQSIQQPIQQPIGRSINPYVLRRNPRYRNNYPRVQSPYYQTQRLPPQLVQNNRAYTQEVIQESAYTNIPKTNLNNQYVPHHPVLKNIPEAKQTPQNRRRNNILQRNQRQPSFEPSTHNVNNAPQPNIHSSNQIVYIDGVPYINTEATYVDPPKNVFIPEQEQTQSPENTHIKSHVQNHTTTNTATNEVKKNNQSEKSYDDSDDDEVEDEDNAEYEEVDENDYDDDDDEDDEDDTDAEFYEKNEQLINEQKEEYARLKKAYEEDDQKQKTNKQDTEKQKA